MNSINKVIIENFQSHENTVLDFSNGLNVILGPSDQGKSAIIRAIKWVLYNEPRGTDFIRHGAKSACVTIQMSNNYSIIRERSKSKNKYTVIDPESNVQIFEGFGNEIPEEVIRAHGIPKIVLDNDYSSSINIADQLEGPFLLSESPALRSKSIGRLTGLHIIDKAVRDCLIDIRRESQSNDKIREEINELNSKIDTYQNLEKIEKIIIDSDKLLEKIEMLISKTELLERISQKYAFLESEIDQNNKIFKALNNLNKCEGFYFDIKTRVTKYKRMEFISDRSTKITEEINESEKIIKKTSEVEQGYISLNNLKKYITKFLKLTELNKKLIYIKNDINKSETIIANKRDIDKLQESLNNLQTKYVAFLKLNDCSKKIESINEEIFNVEEVIVKSNNTTLCLDNISIADQSIKKLKVISQLKTQYDIVQNYIFDGNKYIDKNKEELSNLLEKYILSLRAAGKCPLCNSEISDEKINDILRNYREVY